MIANELRPKRERVHSSRIGLQNLSERYKLITGLDMVQEDTGSAFVVTLPLLRAS